MRQFLTSSSTQWTLAMTLKLQTNWVCRWASAWLEKPSLLLEKITQIFSPRHLFFLCPRVLHKIGFSCRNAQVFHAFLQLHIFKILTKILFLRNIWNPLYECNYFALMITWKFCILHWGSFNFLYSLILRIKGYDDGSYNASFWYNIISRRPFEITVKTSFRLRFFYWLMRF